MTMPAEAAAPFRYRALGYVALNVTDLDRSVRFYQDLVGLELVARNEEVAYLRCSRDHHNLLLHRAAHPGLSRVAFQLESGHEVNGAHAHFERAGLTPQWLEDAASSELRQGPAFRVRERHSGVVFEYFSASMQMAAAYTPTVAQIVRIGHVVIACRDYAASKSALISTFNFQVSDFVEGQIAFLRGFPNPLHHTFAISAAGENHFHHLNFMVLDIDDIGRALHRLNKAGVKIVFGPGRHPPSGSVFLYFLDPDGMTVEYSFGMELFPEREPREPRMLEPVAASMDTWGAVPDAQFAVGGAIGVAG